MFCCAKSHKKLKILDTFNELLCRLRAVSLLSSDLVRGLPRATDQEKRETARSLIIVLLRLCIKTFHRVLHTIITESRHISSIGCADNSFKSQHIFMFLCFWTFLLLV